MSNTFDNYKEFVSNFVSTHKKACSIPLGEHIQSAYGKSEFKMMLFSPHPDDECVVGALPLRMRKELGTRIINVAVTLGSNVDRKQGRLDELMNACKTLGFELLMPCDNALDDINPKGRADEKEWVEKVNLIARILLDEKPEIVLFPHNEDFNSTHIGVNLLLHDALKAASDEDPSFRAIVIETEFWQMMDNPNLMVGLTHEDEAELIFALSAHTEEVERNPYHINHPARMLDNVTRGSEVIGGQGGQAADFDFAMIYRCSVFEKAEIHSPWENGRIINTTDDLSFLFEL